METILKTREWMAIAAILSVMLVLTAFVAVKHRSAASSSLSVTPSYVKNRVEATVKGAVAHPGVYSLPKETTLRELLAVAELTAEADVRRFNLDKVVQQGRAIHIVSRPMITVHVMGAVQSSGEIRVPQGTRVEELVARVSLNEDADARVLKKKRKIKDGEVVNIPKRKR